MDKFVFQAAATGDKKVILDRGAFQKSFKTDLYVWVNKLSLFRLGLNGFQIIFRLGGYADRQ